MAASHGPSSRLLLVAFAPLLLLLLCPVCPAGAAEHVVGDVAFGWDSGINYATWAQKHTFAVGDVLVFQYVNTQHNVFEVAQSAYRSCDVDGGNGVRAEYTSGYDRVVLAEARDYWFICDVPGHCLGGMRVAVNVSVGAGGGGGGPSPNVPLPPNGNAAASPAGGCRDYWMAWGLATLGVLVLMNWAR